MELEEAIRICKLYVKYQYQGYKAINIVLEALENSIPNKKVEDKIKKVNESYGYSTVNKILIEQVLNELLEDK